MKVSSSQEHRTTTESLPACDEFAVREASETFERYNFNNWKQEDEDSFEDSYADLRVLANTCNFCHKYVSSIITDAFLGIRQSEAA